jgi:magnesium-transporting ATPase (P-type)
LRTYLLLQAANIKIWMLTGDKQETAINIGYASKLLTRYTYYGYLLTIATLVAYYGYLPYGCSPWPYLTMSPFYSPVACGCSRSRATRSSTRARSSPRATSPNPKPSPNSNSNPNPNPNQVIAARYSEVQSWRQQPGAAGAAKREKRPLAIVIDGASLNFCDQDIGMRRLLLSMVPDCTHEP